MEKKVIGSLLSDISRMKYCTELKPDMITDVVGKDVYKVILQHYQLGLPVTVIDISQILEGGAYTKSELGAYFKDCISDTCVTNQELKSAVTAIVNQSKARELYELCKGQSYRPNEIHQTLINLNKATEEMLKNEKPKGESMSTIAKRYRGYYGKEHEQGIRLGFYEVDEILNGLNGGDVYIVGARPAVGKSAWVNQVACNVADKGFKVAIFNLEMTDKQILERMIARYSGIGMLRLRKAIKFMEEEQKKFDVAMDKIENNKNLFIFSGSYTPSEIKMLCKNQEFDLVIIDYLQLLKADRNYGNRASEVGEISKKVKEIAMEMKVPVIALSQLNRSKSATDEPELSDLRESGDIEQDASTVIFMWNINVEGTVKGLKVDKNRQGELGKVAMTYDGSHMNFETINHKSFEQTEKEYKNVSRKTENDCPFG